MEGWIKLHRQITEHWIWKDPVKFQWWMDMLLMANHADNKLCIGMQLIECKRGQTVMSLTNWSKRWKVSRDTVRNFLVLLEKDTMISHENLVNSTRITICNYDTYQTDLHDSQTQSKRKANASQTRADINKNVKNDKTVNNEKKEKENFPPQIQKRFLIQISELENFLKSDAEWKNIVCMQNHITIAELENYISTFTGLLKARGEPDKSPTDAKSHFVNWFNLEKQKSKSIIKSNITNLTGEEKYTKF
jgi:hypothetical protein